jgi:hypothetical protein
LSIKSLTAKDGKTDRSGTLDAVGALKLSELLVKMREHNEAHLQELTALSAHLSAQTK